MNKIEKFLYKTNERLSPGENLKVINRSNHDNWTHQALFKQIDEFAKRVVKDVHNSFSKDLFEANYLNIISDEKTIEKSITVSLKHQGHNVTSLANPEMIYRAFNFLKPKTLMPKFNEKLYLIKQIGVDEFGNEITYVINPCFFGFKISFDIYISSLFCMKYDSSLEKGLKKILEDKYGENFGIIYDYVASESNMYLNQGIENGDQEDETLIKGIKSISGIEDDTIFHNFIYESAMITGTGYADILKDL